jgi:threonine/homoserine/homoserine lactone efflux protein
MPTLSTTLAYCGAVIVLLVIPGPSVFYITTRSAAHGRRAGLVSVLGVHTGSVVHIVAAAAGLSALVVASAAPVTALKIAGGVYLVWLGVRTLRAGRPADPSRAPLARSLRRLYLDGFVVNALNPKVALFFLALLPQFIDSQRAAIAPQILLLGAIFIVIGLCSDSVYALVAAYAGQRFGRSARFLRGAQVGEGVFLVGLGVSTLALPHRGGGAPRPRLGA